MVEITIKKVKLSQIKLNPDNPRTISKEKMARLVKSLQEFPEMMELREIVVDETMTVLGGNMRAVALRQAGEKEALAKICKGLTAEQKREFIIKDNASFGEWDFDLLANSWDDLPLVEWGLDLPKDWLGDDEPGEKSGGPAMKDSYVYQLLVECDDEKHQSDLMGRFGKEGLKCRPLIL